MDETATDSSMAKAYDPKATEQSIYEYWLEGGYFTPEIDRSRKPFVIMMPPPNVTGQLHMGHALTAALEDLMTRWHRMLGDPTLFLPGTDHAGIATQVVVERMLAADNLTRQDLGREAFTKTVWEWVDRYGSRIYEQLKRLGASCDWTRQGFTLDEGPSKAVQTTFVNLYKKGLIYRGERIVNWCPRCVTALSDLEVKHREEDAGLYHIRYRIEGGDGELIIATTRPETLLADTAVAINPDDDRYATFAGKSAILPLLGRIIPVVSDEAADPEFGTGALKVTPGHDPADFEIGERHSLPIINILNPDGTMNENAAHYEGVDRLEVRTKIVEELDKEGLLVKIEPYRHSVGHCDRCDQVVEPIVSKQWYMSMTSLAKPAIEAVESGRIKVVPERFTKVYYNWMYNIRDWCISRQLWWGHRIPAWYCQDCDAVVVALDDPTSCDQCGSSNLERDPDVLDTWFSSALWPHSTLGWPNQTEDLDYFYPGSVLETGHDILFFWVARMIMTGIENAGDIPFETIYLHGMVLDPTGIKMSKVKGNVLDPLELVDIYGADALRFALTTGNSPGNDMRLNESKMEASRNFANKIWNASRFVMANIQRSEGSANWSWPPTPEHLEDRWIVARLQTTVSNVDRYMKEFQFGEAQREVHDFLWGEYCDWYLEMSKIRMRAGDDSPLPILAYVLEQTLRLLHPFMPFITEEIWGNLIKTLPAGYDVPNALIVASYPVADTSLADPQAESDIGAVIEMVRAIRNLRAEFRIEANRNVEAIVDAPDIEKVIESESAAIVALAQVDPLIMALGSSSDGAGDSVALVLSRGTVTVPLEGVVDVDREKARLTEELQQIDSGAQRLSARLSKADFLSKAPPEVVEKERARLSGLEDRRIRVAETLSRLGG